MPFKDHKLFAVPGWIESVTDPTPGEWASAQAQADKANTHNWPTQRQYQPPLWVQAVQGISRSMFVAAWEGGCGVVDALPVAQDILNDMKWRKEMMESVRGRQQRHEVVVAPDVKVETVTTNPWTRYVYEDRYWWCHDDGRALWEERAEPWQRFQGPATSKIYWACPAIDESWVTTPSFYES